MNGIEPGQIRKNPAFALRVLLDKGAKILAELCESIGNLGSSPADAEALVLCHEATEAFNLLAEEFATRGSDIETMAESALLRTSRPFWLTMGCRSTSRTPSHRGTGSGLDVLGDAPVPWDVRDRPMLVRAGRGRGEMMRNPDAFRDRAVGGITRLRALASEVGIHLGDLACPRSQVSRAPALCARAVEGTDAGYVEVRMIVRSMKARARRHRGRPLGSHRVSRRPDRGAAGLPDRGSGL